MELFRVIYTLFAKRLRLSNPWNYKAPVLIAVTYMVMLWQQFKFWDAMQGFFWSLCTIIGIAGFGYLSNDFGDRKADHKAGKSNLLSQISAMEGIALLLLFLALAILPWVFYFPLNTFTASLLGAEFLLFLIYILPPFRLKERGLLGVVTDALYAHANPAILAALTFGALSNQSPDSMLLFLMVLGTWQLALGMRNIILHQLKDAENDRISGIRTFVTDVGEKRAHQWLLQFFIPIELLFWLLFMALLTPLTWLPLVAWPIYLAWQAPRQKGKLDARGWCYRYLDDFYIPWFPLLVLISYCFQDWRMIVLVVLHLLLFKTPFSAIRNRILRLIVLPS